MMAEFKHVSGDALKSLNLLAELVRGALELAGLPVHLQPESLSISGAEIDVDTGDDAGRGVYEAYAKPRFQQASTQVRGLRVKGFA